MPQGFALRLASAGVRLSIADHYWLQTVQYIGDLRAKERGGEKLLPLVDLVTDLDPKHGYAYQTAGIVLSAVGRIDESDRILKKGFEHGPRWWTYPFYLAFNHYFYRGDYAEAARWAEIAARTPGASPNVSQLALSLKVKSGSPDDAVHFLEELRKVAKDEKTAAALEEQYKLALLQRDFARLDSAVARYRALGAPPRRIEDLAAAGLVTEIPADPFGGHYFLDADAKVHASGRDFRFKPADPARLHLAPPLLERAAPPSPP